MVATFVPVVNKYFTTLSISNAYSLSNAEFGYVISAVLVGLLSYASLKVASWKEAGVATVLAIPLLITLMTIGFTPVYIAALVGLLFVLYLGAKAFFFRSLKKQK